MRRFFIEIAYNGLNYHGWQIQSNANSVQAEINKALSTILKQEICVTGAGRTDTGVHAQQLFAHFDAKIELDLDKLTYKINSFLPDDIACKNIFQVHDDAHARFNAVSRTYKYQVSIKKDPFTTQTSHHHSYPLDIGLMNEGAKQLMNHKDFSCFSKSKTDTFTNNCKITEAYWKQDGDLLVFTITADRFLRNMVRAIVGTLLEIGQKKTPVSELENIIASKNRSNAGVSVPAKGLSLVNVEYPNTIYLE